MNKLELVNKAIASIMDCSNDYHDLIEQAVREYISKWDMDELKDFVYGDIPDEK